MQVWNYMLWCLPLLKVIAICLFSCLIALKAKCFPSKVNIFIVHLITCMHNLLYFAWQIKEYNNNYYFITVILSDVGTAVRNLWLGIVKEYIVVIQQYHY